MYFRSSLLKPVDDLQKISEEISDDGMIPDDYADSEEKRRIIMNIIDKSLTVEQRQAVILYYFDRMMGLKPAAMIALYPKLIQ